MKKIILPEDVKRLLNELTSNGFEAFIVGGCVRDSLMGNKPHDYDITTNASVDQMKECFRNYRLIETGVKHGTLTVALNHNNYEITTYRIDSEYEDHRHPDSVTFTADLKEDLARRDFTVNAMAYNEESGLIDLYDGQKDLKAGIIRCVGDPEKRFEEDALRILRALRFASRFSFTIEENTEKALFEKAPLLSYVSIERIQNEFTEILLSENADHYLDRYIDVICVFLPELEIMLNFDQNNIHHNLDLWHHTLSVVRHCNPDKALRWAALLHDLGKYYTVNIGSDNQYHFFNHPEVSAKKTLYILKRMKMDTRTTNEIYYYVLYHDYPITSKRTVKRLLNCMDYDHLYQLVNLKLADNLSQSPQFFRGEKYFTDMINLINEVRDNNEAYRVTDLAVYGQDLMEFGYRGQEIGNKLTELLELVVNEEITNDRETLMWYLSSISD